MGPSVSFSSLSRISEDSDSSETLEQLPDSTFIARDTTETYQTIPLQTVISNTTDQEREISPYDHPPTRNNSTPRPQTIQTIDDDQPITPIDQLTHPPEDFLSVHPERSNLNPLYIPENTSVQLDNEIPQISTRTNRIEANQDVTPPPTPPPPTTTTPITFHPDTASPDPSISPLSLGSVRIMEETLERQLETLRLERENHEQRMSALHEACQESLGMRGMFNFPTYRGDENEDVHDFISNYTRAADMCAWNEEKRTRALPLYLRGSASICSILCQIEMN